MNMISKTTKQVSKRIFLILSIFFLQLKGFTQEITVTIGYPDHPDYFLYSIPPADEHARFGGEYYFKVENTGLVDLNGWQLNTIWKTLNNTWGVVEKTVINAQTGEIRLNGPNWDLNLMVGESFVLNGEWIASGSIEDWIDYLPRNIVMTANNASSISVIYDTEGTVNLTNYTVQKVLPFTEDRKTNSDLKVVAYFPLFDAQNAWCSLQRYGENIDQLRVQLYSITPSGQLRAGQDLPSGVDPITSIDYWLDFIDSLGVVDYCEANGIELIPVCYNYNAAINDFDQNAVNTMMTNPTLRSAHINDLIQLLNNHPEFDGIDIDYESLIASDRDNYSLFMEDLAVEVHSYNKILTTAVHTKAGTGTWYGPQAQDYQRIGNAVDEMLIMTYDLHWGTSPTYNDPPPTAGCQATPDWMNDVASFAISEIDDPSKIQLGLPFYGYRWKYLFENHTLNDPGVGLTYNDAQELINTYNVPSISISREPHGKEPYFIIDINGTDWVCYYQDSLSLEYKLESLNKYDLRDYIGGIGIWRLGSENDGMWDAVMQATEGASASINTSFDCSVSTVGIEKIKKETLVVYPNPASDIIYIEGNNCINCNVQLCDFSGKVIRDYGVFNQERITLNTSSITSGFYFIRLSDENNQQKNIRIGILE